VADYKRKSKEEVKLRGKEERRKRTTISNVGQIAKQKRTTKVSAMIKKLLYSKLRRNKAIDWGLLQEDFSRQKYLEVKKLDSPNFNISKSGLVVSLRHPWLTASPDGLVYDPPQG